MNMFDEKDAVDYIRRNADVSLLSDDDLLEIIDLIYDYYDETGELDLDFDDLTDNDDDDPDAEAIIAYVYDALSDHGLSKELISKIVKAELAYEDSLL